MDSNSFNPVNSNISKEWKDYIDSNCSDMEDLHVNNIIKWSSIGVLMYVMQKNVDVLKSISYNINAYEPNYLDIFSTHIRNLTRLTLRGNNVCQADLRIIARSCSDLQMLFLTVTVTVQCTAIKEIYVNNSNLQVVGLQNHHCYDDGTSFNGECLQNLPNDLKELILISCKVGPKVLMESLLRHSHIKRLRLDDCYGIPSDIYKRIITFVPNIKDFSYNFAHVVPSYRSIHASFQPILLRNITLYYNPLVTDELIKYISCVCKKLDDFRIGNAPACNELCKDLFWPSSEKNEYLNISEEGFMCISYMKMLKYIALFGLNIKNSVLFHPALTTLPNLQKVILATRNVDFSDLAKQLMLRCHKLNMLAVVGHTFNRTTLKSTIDILPKDRRRMILCIERNTFEEQEAHYFYSPLITYELETYETFCTKYFKYFEWHHYPAS